MPAINPTVVRLTTGGWRFTWAAGTAPYSIWLDGDLVDTVSATTYDCLLPDYDDYPPDLEIRNSGDTADNDLYPPFIVLQWRGIVGSYAYLIEKYTGASGNPWSAEEYVAESNRGYYRWRSPALVEMATARYRVSVMNTAGSTGTPLEFTSRVVAAPKRPSVTVTVSGGNIVVS